MSTVIAAHESPVLKVLAWEPWDGPLSPLPRTRADVYRVYGNPGVGKIDRKWERENMVTAKGLAMVPRGKLYCHKIAEPHIREGFRRASISCPGYVLTRVGCFNFRHQRHDSKRPLSRHSWGIALDVDPDDNRGVYFKKKETPVAFSEQWYKVWPKSIPPEFVDAMKSVGFAWGADWDEDGDSTDHTFLDPMHFELVDRSKIA